MAFMDGLTDCMRTCGIYVCGCAANTPLALCDHNLLRRVGRRILRRGISVSESLDVLPGARAILQHGAGRYGADFRGAGRRIPGYLVCHWLDMGHVADSVHQRVVFGGAVFGSEEMVALGLRDCGSCCVLDFCDLAGSTVDGVIFEDRVTIGRFRRRRSWRRRKSRRSA